MHSVIKQQIYFSSKIVLKYFWVNFTNRVLNLQTSQNLIEKLNYSSLWAEMTFYFEGCTIIKRRNSRLNFERAHGDANLFVPQNTAKRHISRFYTCWAEHAAFLLQFAVRKTHNAFVFAPQWSLASATESWVTSSRSTLRPTASLWWEVTAATASTDSFTPLPMCRIMPVSNCAVWLYKQLWFTSLITVNVSFDRKQSSWSHEAWPRVHYRAHDLWRWVEEVHEPCLSNNRHSKAN